MRTALTLFILINFLMSCKTSGPKAPEEAELSEYCAREASQSYCNCISQEIFKISDWTSFEQNPDPVMLKLEQEGKVRKCQQVAGLAAEQKTWNEFFSNQFVANCSAGGASKETCSCVLEAVKKNWTLEQYESDEAQVVAALQKQGVLKLCSGHRS